MVRVVKPQNRHFGRNQVEICQKWFCEQHSSEMINESVVQVCAACTFCTYDNVPVYELEVYPNEGQPQRDDPSLYSSVIRDTYQHPTNPRQIQTPLNQPNTNYTVEILAANVTKTKQLSMNLLALIIKSIRCIPWFVGKGVPKVEFFSHTNLAVVFVRQTWPRFSVIMDPIRFRCTNQLELIHRLYDLDIALPVGFRNRWISG